MMKTYHIYVFTQDKCRPCTALKEYISGLSEAEQAELDLVPMNAPNGERTALAEEFNIEWTPTMVVTHIDVLCEIDWNTDEEFCDQEEQTVERYVGAGSIVDALPSTLDAYTYAHSE